jgi:hypothetical protein
MKTKQGSNPSSDLRKWGRSRTIIGGKVVFNDRHCVVDCTIRDMSETGAKLVFSGHVRLPDEFDLEMPQKGMRHRARVMWWAAESCGVLFLTASQTPQSSPR